MQKLLTVFFAKKSGVGLLAYQLEGFRVPVVVYACHK